MGRQCANEDAIASIIHPISSDMRTLFGGDLSKTRPLIFVITVPA